jgi:hypothetical protein
MGTFEEFGKRIDEEISRLKKINDFESFGKHVDEDLARLNSFVKKEVAPEAEKRTAEFLREVSKKLSEAASKLEARKAARSSRGAKSQKNPSIS